jgi:predicted transcriptional regulator
MAEYIDREKIFPNRVFYVNEENPLTSLDALINHIYNLPTADVVPKSEVDWHREAELKAQRIIELESECKMCGEKTSKVIADLQEKLSNAKAEVDRLNAVMKEMDEQRAYTINMLGESLETAKSDVDRWRFQLEAVLEEIPETKREVSREIFEEIERNIINSNFEFMFVNRKYFAELKKKYTEEQK